MNFRTNFNEYSVMIHLIIQSLLMYSTCFSTDISSNSHMVIFHFRVNEEKTREISYVTINSDGRVFQYKPMHVDSACVLNIHSFPFDYQNCSLTFSSWAYTSMSFVNVLSGLKFTIILTCGETAILMHKA